MRLSCFITKAGDCFHWNPSVWLSLKDILSEIDCWFLPKFWSCVSSLTWNRKNTALIQYSQKNRLFNPKLKKYGTSIVITGIFMVFFILCFLWTDDWPRSDTISNRQYVYPFIFVYKHCLTFWSLNFTFKF